MTYRRGAIVLGLLPCLLGSSTAQRARLHHHHAHHPAWANKSAAAYWEHVEQFRRGAAGAAPRHLTFWDGYRPAFNCPWQDRIGRMSEGGKWVCHWQALLEPRPTTLSGPITPVATAVPPYAPPVDHACVVGFPSSQADRQTATAPNPNPSRASPPHPAHRHCQQVYSFGISGETSFEEDLMGRLAGSGCKLFGFDPTVDGFPRYLITTASFCAEES